jgi:hypothetical protein
MPLTPMKDHRLLRFTQHTTQFTPMDEISKALAPLILTV